MNHNDNEISILNRVSEFLSDTIACQYIQHTKNVVDYCKVLGNIEGADMDILIPAAILHDVGRCKDNSLLGHIEKGLPIAEEILRKNKYSEEQINKILLAIEEHHDDLPVRIPSTIEGRILLDADRLEIVGEYGMARWLLSFDVTFSPQEACQLWLDLSKRKDAERYTFFCTDAGEKMGINGFKFCEKFCNGIING